MGDGFPSVEEGVRRVKCPVLVSVPSFHSLPLLSLSLSLNILCCTLLFTETCTNCTSLYTVQVLGVTSDVLFPVQQQRDMAELLRKTGASSHTQQHAALPGESCTHSLIELTAGACACMQVIRGHPITNSHPYLDMIPS